MDDELLGDVRRAWGAESLVPEDGNGRAQIPDRSLAGYRILRRIGAGGMGVVYEAEQRKPRRRVALKVLREGLASDRALQRLELETEVLGRLEHPGIARIYEAGTYDTGFGLQPFFAMELVEGGSLSDFVEHAGSSLIEKLSLFLQVCDAVHHAHQRGVIHRDLKPANLLVDREGQVKVVDFGVARAANSSRIEGGRTETGQLIGTLPYISPEQVRADAGGVDTRADVYALGVVLYELLAGRAPYAYERDGGSFAELCHAIECEQARPLGSWNPKLRGDLETIVSKALEKDRDRRYASASELAADVTRYLNDEPITARPASTRYRLLKFARRHRSLLAAGLLVFTSLVAGIAVATRQASRARAAEAEARDQRDEALSAAKRARSVQELLQEMLGTADPGGAKPRGYTVREALDEAAASLEPRLEGEPGVEAALRRTLGDAYRGLGLYDESDHHLTRARERALEAFGALDPETAACFSSSGVLAFRSFAKPCHFIGESSDPTTTTPSSLP